MRVQRIVLDTIGHIGSRRGAAVTSGSPTITPVVRCFQARRDPQRGGLAAPRRSDEDGDVNPSASVGSGREQRCVRRMLFDSLEFNGASLRRTRGHAADQIALRCRASTYTGAMPSRPAAACGRTAHYGRPGTATNPRSRSESPLVPLQGTRRTGNRCSSGRTPPQGRTMPGHSNGRIALRNAPATDSPSITAASSISTGRAGRTRRAARPRRDVGDAVDEDQPLDVVGQPDVAQQEEQRNDRHDGRSAIACQQRREQPFTGKRRAVNTLPAWRSPRPELPHRPQKPRNSAASCPARWCRHSR